MNEFRNHLLTMRGSRLNDKRRIGDSEHGPNNNNQYLVFVERLKTVRGK